MNSLLHADRKLEAYCVTDSCGEIKICFDRLRVPMVASDEFRFAFILDLEDLCLRDVRVPFCLNSGW